MIEAFEIGVSLALRDGVSESIAQAQRNVEALQKAVDANGLSVRALRDAGVRAASLVSAQPRQGKEQRKEKTRGAKAETAEVAPMPADIRRPVQSDRAGAPLPRKPEPIEQELVGASGDGRTSAPVSVPPAPGDEQDMQWAESGRSIFSRELREKLKIEFAEPADERADIARQPQTVAPTAPAREQVFSLVGSVEQPTPASSGVQPEPVPESDKAGLRALPQTVAPANQAFETIPLVQSIFGSMSLGGLMQAGSDDVGAEPAERAQSVPQGVPTGDEASSRWVESAPLESPLLAQPAAPDIDREGLLLRELVSSRDQDIDDPGAQVDRYSSLTKMRNGLATPLPRADTAPQSVAPRVRGSTEGPPAGDVYLDGVLVGRWMSRFMKREAERADSGPTGFDAKRGRLLPGVTVGG